MQGVLHQWKGSKSPRHFHTVDDAVTGGAEHYRLARKNWDGGNMPIFTIVPFSSIRWSPDSTRLAAWDTTGRDPAISLWFPDRTAIGVLKRHEDRVGSIAWSPDGAGLAAGGGTVMLWDLETAEPQWVGVLFNDKRSVTFSAGGKVLHGHSDLIEQQFVYVVEDSGGRLDLLKPSEFYELQPD